ncbi:MAG: hypothetical protein KDA17_01650, partial [Candidatus Saccharibacteria bacterium]|nr:hypothetical protein [Candidatus Saccharibacteria bacterium]
ATESLWHVGSKPYDILSWVTLVLRQKSDQSKYRSDCSDRAMVDCYDSISTVSRQERYRSSKDINTR